MKKSEYFSVIDVGTSKICVVIAKVDVDAKIEVLGVGQAESFGLKMGVVSDIYQTKKSIGEAITTAEREAGVKANDFFVSISGDHIKSMNLDGSSTISNFSESEIKKRHIKEVIENAKNKAGKKITDKNLKIIHAIPQSFHIDNESIQVENPLGKYGCDLTGKVHIIFAKNSNMRDIGKCIELAGYRVRDFIYSGLASGYCMLDDEQKKYGVILVDIGAGTTDICVYYDGSLFFSKSIAQGGIGITEVLAIGLNTKTRATERLKVEKGDLSGRLNSTEVVKVVDINGEKQQTIEIEKLSGIIEFKMKEILENVYSCLFKEDYYDVIKAGIVLTGGTSKMGGLKRFTKKMFNKFINLGKPDIENKLSGAKKGRLKDATYSTVVGLLCYAAEQFSSPDSATTSGVQSDVWGKIKKFFKDFV